MKKILILGGTSYLGSRLIPHLRLRPDFEICVQSRSPQNLEGYADPNEAGDLDRLIQKSSPDVVINLIGATDVDRCETDPAWAHQANVSINLQLRALLKGTSSHTIYISTDHLYDGAGLNSEDTTVVRNIYAQTKLEGERALADLPSTVLRTNFYGKSMSQKPSFTDWAFASIQAQTPMKLFSDVIFSATHLSTLCAGIQCVIDRPSRGIFNFGTVDAISKADFILEFAAKLRAQMPPYQIVASSSVQHRAPRPSQMAMDSTKFQQTFGFNIGKMADEITKAAQDYL